MMKNTDSQSQTKLKDHKFTGKKLVPPLASLNMTRKSWIDDRLPEMLWAVLLTNAFDRKEVLERFNQIVNTAVELTNTQESDWRNKPMIVTLSGIDQLDKNKKIKLIKAIANDEKAKKVLSPMLYFDKLPSKTEWQLVLGSKPSESDGGTLAKAVAGCFFHQSQQATDCRWVKALYAVKSGFILFTQKVEDTPKLILNYASHTEEELRHSRPTVRSLEISLDSNEVGNDWASQFWTECFNKTKCLTSALTKEELTDRYPTEEELKSDKVNLQDINQKLTDHFWSTLKNTNRDPKHEVSFGIAMYAADLATSSLLLGMNRSSQGRMVLRSLVECLISLKYLFLKDDISIWQTFLNHGMGQAKLVVQRSEEESRSPEYLDLKNLGQIANDDVWVEFLPIDIGSWDNMDLRKRAIEVGLKDKYDDYYTWPSSFSHGQWGAIRESVYDLCGNPLHRFHRIPLLYSMNLKDVRKDIYLLLKDILDVIYALYPRE
jgi:hypothetical protein